MEACAVAGFEEAEFRARRELSGNLNQMMRRLRQCTSTEEVAAWLADSATSSFCRRAALFEVMGPSLRGVEARGFESMPEGFDVFEAPLQPARAFEQAGRERDPLAAIASVGEISDAVLEALGQAPGGKAHLFPVVIGDKTVAILYATGDENRPVDTAALELLTLAASSAAQLLAADETPAARPARTEPTAAASLVSIRGIDMGAHAAAAESKPGDLKKEEIDSRARWFARVEAARLRLFHREALERGRMERNIYRALREQIDAARRTYAQDFLAVSPAITDYLDKELICLAHDDAKLLGPEYPGSLV